MVGLMVTLLATIEPDKLIVVEFRFKIGLDIVDETELLMVRAPLELLNPEVAENNEARDDEIDPVSPSKYDNSVGLMVVEPMTIIFPVKTRFELIFSVGLEMVVAVVLFKVKVPEL